MQARESGGGGGQVARNWRCSSCRLTVVTEHRVLHAGGLEVRLKLIGGGGVGEAGVVVVGACGVIQSGTGSDGSDKPVRQA